MRVLTATSTTQGDRPDDCCWTAEGELVSLPVLECSCPDCGCDRCFSGLTSHRATTTCVVTDVPLDPAGLRHAVVRSLAVAGWLVDLDGAGEIDVDPPGDHAEGPVRHDVDDPDDPVGAGIEDPDHPDPFGGGDVVESWVDLPRLAGEPADAALSAIDRELVDDVIARIVEVAESFPVGTVLARAEGGVVVRRPAPVGVP